MKLSHKHNVVDKPVDTVATCTKVRIPWQFRPKEREIAKLLLDGYDNQEIANQLQMARRTVKAYCNRFFVRFGIQGGIKRVKLATLLYRERKMWWSKT
jgi:DNA-binding NarL/FixJ family response regulator